MDNNEEIWKSVEGNAYYQEEKSTAKIVIFWVAAATIGLLPLIYIFSLAWAWSGESWYVTEKIITIHTRHDSAFRFEYVRQTFPAHNPFNVDVYIGDTEERVGTVYGELPDPNLKEIYYGGGIECYIVYKGFLLFGADGRYGIIYIDDIARRMTPEHRSYADFAEVAKRLAEADVDEELKAVCAEFLGQKR